MSTEEKPTAVEAPRLEPTTANRQVILEGLDLIYGLVDLRKRRRDGDEPDKLANDLERWYQARTAWENRMMAAHQEGIWMPLAVLQERLSLTPRELDVLLIALAPQIDPEFLDHVASARSSFLFRGIDVELTLGLLFHNREERFVGRALLAPNANLIRNGLLALNPIGTEINPHEVEIRPTESLSNFVLERALLSGAMSQFCELVTPDHEWNNVILDEEQKALIWEVVAGEAPLQRNLDDWGYRSVFPKGKGITLLFSGPPGTGKTAFAHAIAHRLDRQLLVVHSSRLMGTREPLQPILNEVFRIAQLAQAVVLLDDSESLLADRDARFLALLESLDHNDGLLILTTNNAPRIDFAMARRILYRLDFENPNPSQREAIWEVHLPPSAPLAEDIDVPILANTYEFSGGKIRNTVLIALSRLASEGGQTLSMEHLRNAAETQLGARFDDLAVKSGSSISLERLILPEKEMEKIHEVLAACRHREFVLNRWGFGARLPTGRGICVLFDGPPGTGKTFTAEILASELKLPLYRVHIPNVVSKWVGETERNIAEIFVRARAARAMLLFDEADSLFGRRSSNAQGANDRYANMEVNLLLQEIERYDGITVLTTNLFGNLDEALQRRIQFRVTFPFPEPEERANIWKILTPPEAPLHDDVDFSALGEDFELAGGHIKNALLRAAYRAREDDSSIAQRHLSTAAIAECQAQGKIVRVAPVDDDFEPKVPEPTKKKPAPKKKKPASKAK